MAAETGLFEVMEVDEDSSLMIFAEDQQDHSDLSLDIDLTHHDRISIRKNNACAYPPPAPHQNQNANNLNCHHSNINIAPHYQVTRKKKRMESRISVVVRKRPMNAKEVENAETDIGKVYPRENRITICEPRLKVDLTKFTQYHEFKFDHCFDESTTNKQIYETCVKPLFDTILSVPNHHKSAGKATCFGYGQTGSGKTYTLLGSTHPKTGHYLEGLYAMAVRDLFKFLPPNNEIMVSFYEIYGGKLFDLLADRKQIVCREDGKQKVNIIGLKRIKCENVEFLMNVISAGNGIRQTGSTGANNTSSRSHAILSMDILPIGGRLSFIDLAGSERGADTQNNDKQTRIEGAEINKSLLALKECIRALDQKASHKPFRGSKLTQVLKESFIGNSRTLMIANISPNSGSCENTLNTLRYAYRVKELKNENESSDAKSSGKASRALSRNRSEPNLSLYKAPSRPGTARKRGTNHATNNRKERENWKKQRNKYTSNKERKRNNLHKNSKNTQHRDRGKVNNDNDSEYSVNESRLHRIKRRKLQQNVTTENRTGTQQPIKKKASAASQHHNNNEERQNDNDVDMMNSDGFKANLTKKQLIKAHRKHIDEFMILIKEDMQLLKSFDKDEFDTDDYQQRLKHVLDRQTNAVLRYKSKVFK